MSGVLRPNLSVSEVGPKRVANVGLILEVRAQKGLKKHAASDGEVCRRSALDADFRREI